MLAALLLVATAQAADLPLGDLGSWQIPEAWTVQTTSGGAPEAVGAVLGGPDGTATVVVVGSSTTLSPAGLVHQATGTDAGIELALEQHGSLWWWHGSGPTGSAWSTGRGATTVVVSSAASDVDSLLDGLVLSCPGLDIDETWMSFTLPAAVPWLHQYASPWSWTRGEGFAAVDLVFERPSLDEAAPPPTGAMAELAGSLPAGWELVEGEVGVDKVSGYVAAQALGGGLIAAPGSHLKAHIVILRYRDGMAQVELRAEGPDADLVAANDLLPLASTVALKKRFDGGYGARSIPWHTTTERAAADAQNMADLLSASSDLVTGLTGSGDDAQALLQPQDNGLTGLQQAGFQAIESYQAGVAPTATESTTALAIGFVPMVQQSFDGYFSPGSTETSSIRGVGASISQGNRVFGQRGTIGANWVLAWPQDGFNDTSAASAGLDGAPHTAFSIKLDGAFLLDPTTHLLPHRIGNFGEWELDIGLATPIAFQFQSLQPTDGPEQKISQMSFG
ncbi:MAG: hypothetical protein GXP62_16285, partial [Oligoflexia bacterium]|nr:hypothetical protein [Oligoflexia bacterium]